MVYFSLIISKLYHKERSIPCQKNVNRLFMLAQNMLFKICSKHIEFIKNIIISTEFIARHSQSETDFTRGRTFRHMESSPRPTSTMARISQLYNTLNKIAVDTLISPNISVNVTLPLNICSILCPRIWFF
jgi:hypothetical protein